MDIDRARERRRPLVFKPPVIRLPAIGTGNQNHVTRSLVIQLVAGSILAHQYFRHTFTAAEPVGHPVHRLLVPIGHEDMRELMVHQRPSGARNEVQVLSVAGEKDAATRTPRPLALLKENGGVRFYRGRSFVVVTAK